MIAAIKESLWWRSVHQNETLFVGNFRQVHPLPLLHILTLKNQLLGLSLLKEVLYMPCNYCYKTKLNSG